MQSVLEFKTLQASHVLAQCFEILSWCLQNMKGVSAELSDIMKSARALFSACDAKLLTGEPLETQLVCSKYENNSRSAVSCDISMWRNVSMSGAGSLDPWQFTGSLNSRRAAWFRWAVNLWSILSGSCSQDSDRILCDLNIIVCLLIASVGIIMKWWGPWLLQSRPSSPPKRQTSWKRSEAKKHRRRGFITWWFSKPMNLGSKISVVRNAGCDCPMSA